MKTLVSILAFLAVSSAFGREGALGDGRKLGDRAMGDRGQADDENGPARTCSKDTQEGKDAVKPLLDWTRKVLTDEKKWPDVEAKLKDIEECNKFNFNLKLAFCLKSYFEAKKAPLSKEDETTEFNKARVCFEKTAYNLFKGAAARMLEQPATASRKEGDHQGKK